ncbi:predicted protein [Streptomyces viridosporus ATCC 14672]|uniref:Predicted protein n=1 Tax=Streptomyces viridosporus (strain ATCC 14672 / DSM 40746 / JCM 4963 / KCTC 9882 / NRRL B-12104 / FH 1290) TaxID=566461 RepID=D6A279_STRV1|nr:predicted protein [Streptomyces viridosporus ATCC 14672]
MGRASKILAPTSCFTGQVHRLPDAPEAYGAKITRPKAAPAQSRSTDLAGLVRADVGKQPPYARVYVTIDP